MLKKDTEIVVEQSPVEQTMIEDTQDIKVNDPQILRPKELPLVVELPEGSSKAQIVYSKTINAYAYQNPEKWEQKKDALIAKLKSLKNAPDPKEESALKINNSLI